MNEQIAKGPPPEERRNRRPRLTPGRLVALVAGLLLVIGIGRQLRRVPDLLRHKRRLQLAFSILVLLRQLRREMGSR